MILPIFENESGVFVVRDASGVELRSKKKHYGVTVEPNFVEPVGDVDRLAGVVISVGKSGEGKTTFVHKAFPNAAFIITGETNLIRDYKKDFPDSTMKYEHAFDNSALFIRISELLNDKVTKVIIVDSTSLLTREGEQADAGHITHEWSSLLSTCGLAARSVNKTLVFLINPMSSKETIIDDLVEKGKQACTAVFDCTKRRASFRFAHHDVSDATKQGRDWVDFDPYKDVEPSIREASSSMNIDTKKKQVNVIAKAVATNSGPENNWTDESAVKLTEAYGLSHGKRGK